MVLAAFDTALERQDQLHQPLLPRYSQWRRLALMYPPSLFDDLGTTSSFPPNPALHHNNYTEEYRGANPSTFHSNAEYGIASMEQVSMKS